MTLATNTPIYNANERLVSEKRPDDCLAHVPRLCPNGATQRLTNTVVTIRRSAETCPQSLDSISRKASEEMLLSEVWNKWEKKKKKNNKRTNN